MTDYEAQRVPAWATATTGHAEDFEDMRLTVLMTAGALALSPDAFNYWLRQELDGLKKTMMRAYHDQHA